MSVKITEEIGQTGIGYTWSGVIFSALPKELDKYINPITSLDAL
jgi:hypothetical protein